MKKTLIIVLVLAPLVIFTGFSGAQQQDKQQTPPTVGGPPSRQATTIKTSKSNSSERYTVDNPSQMVLKGTVTEVSPRDKTFTVSVVISAAKLRQLPKVGEKVDITYTGTPVGGPIEASNLNLSKSNIN